MYTTMSVLELNEWLVEHPNVCNINIKDNTITFELFDMCIPFPHKYKGFDVVYDDKTFTITV